MIEGSCFCGEVKVKAPETSLWCAHCHCTMCQRAHGAAFVTWVGYDETQVEIGGDALQWYASSEKGERGFCKQCGTTLLFRSSQWPGEIHVTRANLGEIDRVPQKHGYSASRVDWIWEHDDLPRS